VTLEERRAFVAAVEAQHGRRPGDNYDASMDFGNMPEDALLLAKLGYVVAETPAWPDWHEQSEFKPVRDRARDSRAPSP
jgi:hypothetical protein